MSPGIYGKYYFNDAFRQTVINRHMIRHAILTPITALKTAIHKAESPKSHPILPAKPNNMTAEKYAVPYEKAVIQGSKTPPPIRKSGEDLVLRMPTIPTIIIMEAYNARTTASVIPEDPYISIRNGTNLSGEYRIKR